LFVGLLAQHATGAEAPVVRKVSAEPELLVDAELLRTEIDSYVRELDRQMRATLNEEWRRELARKAELASDERRTKT
jgi:hypothetical protein